MKIFGIDISKPPARVWCVICGSDPSVKVDDEWLCDKHFITNEEARRKNHIRKNISTLKD